MNSAPEIAAQADLHAHYARTALARMGIAFERGMAIAAVRIAVEGAARAAQRTTAKADKVAA